MCQVSGNSRTAPCPVDGASTRMDTMLQAGGFGQMLAHLRHKSFRLCSTCQASRCVWVDLHWCRVHPGCMMHPIHSTGGSHVLM